LSLQQWKNAREEICLWITYLQALSPHRDDLEKVLAKHLFVCYTSTLHTRRIVSTHGMGSGKSAKRAGIFCAHVEINVTANNRSLYKNTAHRKHGGDSHD